MCADGCCCVMALKNGSTDPHGLGLIAHDRVWLFLNSSQFMRINGN